jgi:chromosome segregation ATPase
MNSELDQANAQRSELQTKLDQASSEIAGLKRQLEQANASREELQTELNQAKSEAQPPPVVFAPIPSGQ